MKVLFSFTLALLFFMCNEATAEWNRLKCQFKCTAEYCSDPNRGKECMDNCKTNVSNCSKAYNNTKQREEEEKRDKLQPGECINCRTETRGGTEPGEPITRHKICDCKNPDGSMSEKTEDLPAPRRY